MQHITCNIDLSCSFYYLFFSFVLIELKPFILKGEVLEKVRKSAENKKKVRKKVRKSAKKCENYERFCPLVVAL